MNAFTDGLSTGSTDFSFENYNSDGFWDSIELTVAETVYGIGRPTTGLTATTIGYGFEHYSLVEYWTVSKNVSYIDFVNIKNTIAKYEIDYDPSTVNSSDTLVDAYMFDPNLIDVQREESTEYQYTIGFDDFDYLPSTITVLAS